jgi:membrane protein implicated in regulation of membrane protease activity
LSAAGFAYICAMAKLAALLAALTVTVLCGLLALYAARLSVLIFLHWEAWVAISLLFYASIFVAARRSKRQAERQAAKEEPLTPSVRRPLHEL